MHLSWAEGSRKLALNHEKTAKISPMPKYASIGFLEVSSN